MNFIKHFWILGMVLGTSFLITACSDDNGNEAQGTLNVELTDGPLDDAQVQGVFVSVASIDVDGQALGDFNGKQTIELSAYQKGTTRLMGSDLLATGSYNNMSLTLDLDTDADGNSPGCYVLTNDGTRHPLTIDGNADGKINVGTGAFDISDQLTTNVVIDFDLRKALRYRNDGPQDQYDFVTNTELSAALRVVDKEKTGAISGKAEADGVLDSEARIVAYAYQAGTYNENLETQPQGSGETLFANALASAKVDANGDYILAFLPDGEYEIVYAVYNDSNNDGTSEFSGTCNIGLLGNTGISPGILTVEAGFAVTLNVSILGIRP